MNLKESELIEEVFGKKFKLKIVEDLDYERAAFTHYLYSHDQPEGEIFKTKAVDYFKKLEEIRRNQEFTWEAAEEAIQYSLFDYKTQVPFPEPEFPAFKFIDLFAGIGGFRLAFQSLGGKCVFTSEWDEQAKKTYFANFGEVPFGDITKEETKGFIPNNFDILCAGFPCQAFSIAGYQKGFADTRGTLFFDLEQIIEKKRPKAILLENVKNLASHDNKRTLKVILEVLEEKLGYRVVYKVLNSMTHANIPQNRERIFIVAFDPKQVKNYMDFTFPEPIPLTKTIHDIIDGNKKDENFYYSKNHMYYDRLNKSMTSTDTLYQWRRVYVRENKSNVCPTLTANMGAGGHNVPLIRDKYGIRKLTPRECFSFQGYPVSEYVFPKIANSKLYMQAGNSVTVPLIKRIGENILEVLL
ncbi:DNA cytosine methyltransferase [Cognataquiflexum rubidum]|uniref:DNA cytosine methyltransferase n=1 Tax=Cognataquiflexum rubidum TaxID=2922273 RepID=UPI001F145A43|nr:DNA cytosine methyltransferase [Cognataquiflexum rubidum]MCH6236116.1 DNA cytosine methyltransferase [Cognataquiflexum rubidum]